MYGGRGLASQHFDDIHVLSLPSFTWTKVYSGESARFGHTCHLVGNRTMLTVGGAATVANKFAPCDWQLKGVGVFDISTLIWGSVYDMNAPAYEVPAQVISTIGGS